MTLQEALQGHMWIPDPKVEHRARVAGPDTKTAIIVEEVEEGGLDCWLWCNLTDQRVSDVLHTEQPDGLEGVFERLFTLRARVGDCPLCERPLAPGTNGTSVIWCVCGYSASLE